MTDKVFAAWEVGYGDALRLADDPVAEPVGRYGMSSAERRMYDRGFDRATDIIRYEREGAGDV